MKLMNAVLVTNVPAPYRVPVWHRVANLNNIKLDLIFCAPQHIDTSIVITDYAFTSHFLTGRYDIKEKRFMHMDIGVWTLLNKLNPDVVITTGYIPTFLFAFLWAKAHKKPHIAMTDGTLKSEASFSWLHRLVRHIVLNRSASFVGACEGSSDLFKYYGVPNDRIHKAYLCANNDLYSSVKADKNIDFIFCGRFVAHKRPLFAMQVAVTVAKKLNRKTSINFVGSGVLEKEMRQFAIEITEFVDTHFSGYASQAELPNYYANAKIFLFPSEWDPWGVVANEACATGLPVIVSPYAGVSGELIIDGTNGFIRELEVDLWAQAAAQLLSDTTLYQTFSQNSRTQVAEYSFDNSAKGLSEAIKQAYELTQ